MNPVSISVDSDTFSEATVTLSELLRASGRPDLVPLAFIAGGVAEMANQRSNGTGPCAGWLNAGTLTVSFQSPGASGGCVIGIDARAEPTR